MPRPEKVQAVADIKERIADANAVFLAEYAGLSVKEQQELRRRLRESGAEFKVVKMTLTRRAADELDLESLDELLVGPTGLTFADGDPVTAAKALDEFANSHEVFIIKGGLLGRDFLAPEKVRELAKIEPREVLLAKLAGAFQAPMANMAGLLAALPRGLATAMSQLIDKKAEAAPAEEARLEDAPEASAAEEAAEETAAQIAEETAAAKDDAEPAGSEDTVGSDDSVDDLADATEAGARDAADDADEDSAKVDDDEGDEPESEASEAATTEDETEDKDDDEEADSAEEE